jgi:hypothetical protein
VIISGRLRSDWKMVSSDAQAACEFVRSKPLSDCPYSGFSACGYAADNPKAVPFAAVLSNPKSGNRRAGVAAGLAHALAPIGRPAARKQTLTSGLPGAREGANLAGLWPLR